MISPEPGTDLEKIPQPSSEPPQKYSQERWLKLLLGVVLLIAGGTAIILRLTTAQPSNPKAANGPPPGVPVQLAPVQLGNIEESSEYIATLESRRSVNLQPRIQGQVSQIFVKSGDVVSSNAPIMQVDARQQQAAVRSVFAAGQVQKAQLGNARANLKALKAQRLADVADLHLNQKDYARYSTLADQGAVARQIKDQYIDKLATSKSQLAAIDSQIQAQEATITQYEKSLQQADANTRQQQVQLQFYKILAPFSGTVGDIPVKIGDFVSTTTVLATVTQNKPLEVRISVPLERGPELHEGLPVELINAQGHSLGHSQVFFISPNINNTSQSILIKAIYDNSDEQLRANQLIRAKVIWHQVRGVLIPITSVAHIAGQNFVFVAQTIKSPQGGTQLVARQKTVKLGEIVGNNYQVLSGLQPDEKMIVSGLLNLRDGLPIVPQRQ